jgi:DNA-binding transcriptional MerR regulator
MKRYMTTAEVAGHCRAAPETVRYWRHIGTGPKHFKVGRRVLYDPADVEAWIDEPRTRSGPTSVDLREAATIYQSAERAPTATVAKHFDIAHRTASLWISRARKLGYL